VFGSARAKRCGNATVAATIRVRRGKFANGLEKPGAARRKIIDRPSMLGTSVNESSQ
jgi:hypothetical protein